MTNQQDEADHVAEEFSQDCNDDAGEQYQDQLPECEDGQWAGGEPAEFGE